ncbi:type II toxin-antitoxin system RelE/ParE family toxin [Variovorax sp. J2P1-31]
MEWKKAADLAMGGLVGSGCAGWSGTGDLRYVAERLQLRMYSVIETEEFSDWLGGLKDRMTRARLQARLRKATLGNLGDVKPVGDGVFEMREFFGPGWRMYYVLYNGVALFMLGGGDKSSQERDIERAKEMAQELQNEQDQDPPV